MKAGREGEEGHSWNRQGRARGIVGVGKGGTVGQTRKRGRQWGRQDSRGVGQSSVGAPSR